MTTNLEHTTAHKTVTEKAAAHWTELPNNEEIDALLSLYEEADRNVDAAVMQRNLFGDQIEELIAKHGFLPPRAKKSKRIQGDILRATLSQSHSVDVDNTAVQRFFALLKELALGPWFRKLFRREVIFVLREDAQALFNSLVARLERKNTDSSKLQLLFAQTLKIEGRSARLEVEPIKKEKAA